MKAAQRILASFPHGPYFENLEVQKDGRLLYTDYLNKKIGVMNADGSGSTFSELDAHPMSLITIDSGYLVAASGVSFLAGQNFVKTQQFILLDKGGKQTGQFPAPQAMAFNGMAELPNGIILIADSIAATIWKVDISKQEITPWIQHPTLSLIPDQPVFLPGANGIKVRAGGVLVSNTSRGSLLEIKFDAEGNPTGAPEQIADVGRIDDFWIRPNGQVLYTTHSDQLKQVEIDGSITEVLAMGGNGCTAIGPFPLGQDRDFVFVNDGGMYEGHKDPATIVLVTLND